ncbi:NADH-quinone oxidoreductase subunit NuoG [Aliikangiella coralliicola]|uniref:NADH-quinone oxidoreductase n=1 Tax=Aliikangiella coralliicola TaxID=2592383 RepID=A0A545UEC5_9GAMM|nr:NADH-quinone oxidoreductase subunit NuoG [Aliikangiella coralliicola]TQV87830.1 NADH-quinone oxidoreductase subunit G [Aliikangiella coralliicola]
MGKVHLEIDGNKLEAEVGSMIIEVADKVGIDIPRFCYHKKLSVAANCRMCMVDVSNIPKAVPACATPVAEGMIIQTKTPKAIDAQKSVMEFLLINHPLDCPVCDQGGECELQDLSVGYGEDISRFTEGKRVVEDKNLGPLIATDMTRCIHCTRCVRFGQEVVGIREMGATGRGEHVEIGTYIEGAIESEVSANIIDLCPVGALTAKPSLFKARAWELRQSASIAAHDCLGSNVYVHHRGREIIRVVPRENESINEVWLSDRDRFSYQALTDSERLLKPRIKQNGEWQDTEWETALNAVVSEMKRIIGASNGEDFGVLVGNNITTEESYLAQKFIRGVGCNNIDFRVRRRDFSGDGRGSVRSGFNFPMEKIDHMDATLLIAADLRHEQPLTSLRVRKSTGFGKVMAINPFDGEYNFRLTQELQPEAKMLAQEFAAVLVAADAINPDVLSAEAKEWLNGIEANDTHQQIAKNLVDNEASCILMGVYVQEHPQAEIINWLAESLASVTQSDWGYMTLGCNAAGNKIAGAVPMQSAAGGKSEPGKNAKQMLTSGLKSYFLINCEPDVESVWSKQALQNLQNAECVIALTPFADGRVPEYADIMLPIAGCYETSGTYINVEGKWQSFAASVSAPGDARPGWKVLRVLANLFELSGFDYESSKQVIDELHEKFEAVGDIRVARKVPPPLMQVSEQEASRECLGLYMVDPMVRRAKALQQTPKASTHPISISRVKTI